jgi:hypothetical protein
MVRRGRRKRIGRCMGVARQRPAAAKGASKQ